MKLAVLAALTTSVLAVCPDMVMPALFTDKECTTAYEAKVDDTKKEETTDTEKKDETKTETETKVEIKKPASGTCEKYDLMTHGTYG